MFSFIESDRWLNKISKIVIVISIAKHDIMFTQL